MTALEGIDPSDLKEFLGKSWLTHDGMWFFSVCQAYGIEAANRLNRAAIQAMAPFEVKRCRKLLGMGAESPATFAEVRDFMDGALRAILPESILSVSSFTAPSPNVIRWEWQDGKCFAYEGMKRLGVADQYVCGVIYRIECWFDALRIPFTVDPKLDLCVMARTGKCSGEFVFQF